MTLWKHRREKPANAGGCSFSRPPRAAAGAADALSLDPDTPSLTLFSSLSFSFLSSLKNNSDETKYAPKAQLGGTILTWGDYYTKVVNEVLAGTWKPGSVWGGLRDGFIKMAPLSPAVPKDVQDQVKKLEAQIVAGKFHPFTGPVVDQDGKVRVPAGQVIADHDLEKMDYYVQGVASKLPGK